MRRAALATLLLIAAATLGFDTAVATADDFAVTSYFPAGGRVGTTVEVTVNAKFARWPVEVWTSDTALSVAAAEDKGKLSLTIAAEATPGVYYFRLYDAQGESRLCAFVVSTTDETVEQEPNDRRDEAQPLSGSPTVINGRLAKAGDVDTFSMQLAAGQTVVAEMAAYRPLGSPMDGVLQVATPAGAILAQQDDSPGFDPRIVFTAPEAGTYLVRTFCFPTMPNSTIAFSGAATHVYRLTVSTTPFARFAMPHAVEFNHVVPVAVHGWNIPVEGIAVVPTPLEKGDHVVVHAPQLTGTLVLPVVQHRATTRAEMIAELAADDEGLPRLEVPLTVTGRIAPDESSHEYRFTAAKDDKLALAVEARTLGSMFDSVLRVSDATGKQLAEVDDVGKRADAVLDFTAPVDGEFVVSIRDLHRRHDEAFFYNLTVQRIEPSYRLKVASDRFTVKPGEALEIPVTVERLHGFSEPIEVSLAGLDGALAEGLTVATVTSKSDDDSAKEVKLSLVSLGTGFSGVVRVVGTTGGDSPTILARAPIETLGIDVSELWLTALVGEAAAK